MTERLYWTDARLRRFTARVEAVEHDGHHVVLDRTAFYPTSGGQPHDLGALAGIPVVDVQEDGERILHRLARPLTDHGLGAAVEGVVDDARRTDHSTQHTAQHLLSAILEDRFRRPTVAFHLGTEVVSIDVAGLPIGAPLFGEVEQAVADVIRENRSIASTLHTDVSALRLRKPTDRVGTIRVVTIDGLDVNACGGTHLDSTGEIGALVLLDAEKVRDATRLTFVAGVRALQRVRADRELLAAGAAALGCAAEEVPALASRQKTALLAAEKELKALRKTAASYEARERHAATPADAWGRRLLRLDHPDALDDATRALALGFAALPGGVALVTSGATRSVLLAASADTGLDCGAILKAALAAVGGRGGGQATSAQGSVPDAAALEAVRALVVQVLV